MIVVAGKYKGKRLIAPKGDSVRPTTTRIKETLFNILQRDIPNSRVLDLFAGSGALGIESLSRGASHVTFVDASRTSIAAIKENLGNLTASKSPKCGETYVTNGTQKCGQTECDYTVYNCDFASHLDGAARRGVTYDVIFLDPPYATSLGELAIDMILEKGILSKDGVIVFEHGSEKSYALKNLHYKQRTKPMGTITVEFIRKKSVALMTGSFDPFTKGHEAVLDEALCRFDEVVVGCFVNPDKHYVFDDEMRLEIVQTVCDSKQGARAISSDKYVYEVAKTLEVDALVRGLRGGDDANYEEDMAKFNAEHGFETTFIKPLVFSDISSTAVKKQLANGDFSGVPACAVPLLQSPKYQKAIKGINL